MVEESSLIQLSLFVSGRKCAYAFMELPYSKRIRIAIDLGLLGSRRECALYETENHLWRKIFSRVKERNMVEEFWQSIQKRRASADS